MLTDLPTELLIRILRLLSLSDIAHCKRVELTLNATIADSAVIQYDCALDAAGLDDNPASSLPLRERLELLRNQERAWMSLTPCSVSNFHINFLPSGIYGLTSGAYLLGECFTEARKTQGIKYLKLPNLGTSAQPDGNWISLATEKDREIMGVGLALQEHDLAAVARRWESK